MSNQPYHLDIKSTSLALCLGPTTRWQVHRRTLHDDSRGVAEPINETTSITSYADSDCEACRIGEGLTVRGSHMVMLHSPKVTPSFTHHSPIIHYPPSIIEHPSYKIHPPSLE